ncbi:hypothetical protein [Streptomyces sp. ME19-01-6]|uniref:hypothetical protein n=1 Tax=Streptomyces sp. ME19-01-6 TaxID=3028686 RepID=UPI0039F4FBB3
MIPPHPRPRAVLAMASRTAQQVLDAAAPARPARLTALDPGLVLDDFTTRPPSTPSPPPNC